MRNFFKKIIVSILTLEARLVLKKYKPKIVAVTGSVGKTSAKDAIYSVMSPSFFVRKSEKSFNSEIGIPLAILGRPSGWGSLFAWLFNIFEGLALILLKNHYPKWLVLEVGADRPDDIKNVSMWLKPDVVVVTRLPSVPVHVEFFDSPEDVISEKKYLVDALKSDGLLVVNNDDDTVVALKESVLHRAITFGFLDGADVRASNYTVLYKNQAPTGMTFRVDYKGSSVPITISGTVGKQYLYAVLSALSIGISQGLNIVSMGKALKESVPPPGRMSILSGIKQVTILDDSYNSSPAALFEALSALSALSASGKKIAVLGDMMELGRYAAGEHKKAGEQAAGICDVLVTIGVRARGIALGALEAGMSEKFIFQYDDSRRAGKELEAMISEGDVVLVKGSQSTRMERVVEEIMAHPEDKAKLLVRQEKEWLAKP